MLSRVSARELVEWELFDQLEPSGDYRADLRSGQICAVLANVNRAKGGKVYSPQDFLLFREQQTAEDHKRILKQWAGLYGDDS